MKRASITVEASFIVPIVVWIIFVFICHALNQSDIVVMELTADRVLEEALTGEVLNESDDIIIKEKMEKMVMAHSIENVTISENENSYGIEVMAKSKLNLRYMWGNKTCNIIREIDKEKVCSKIRGLKVVK